MYGEQRNFSATPSNLYIAYVTMLKLMVLIRGTLFVSERDLVEFKMEKESARTPDKFITLPKVCVVLLL